MRAILLSLVFVITMLAGCADADKAGDSSSDQILDKNDVNLGTFGGISGLLVDDRYRPIDLEDGQAGGEFQALGFVLVQETGTKHLTTANGEFQVLNLEPGTYTLRVSAEGYEAIPQKIQINAGEFSEITILARRVLSDNESILTFEYSIFIPCAMYATVGCTIDNSGDSYRPGFSYNFEDYSETLTYAVVEVLGNNPGLYCFEVRTAGAAGTSGDQHFANYCTESSDSKYMRGVLQPGENYMADGEDAWDPAVSQDAILFYFGNNEATCWSTLQGSSTWRCAGVGLGVKAQIIYTVFLGEPSVDISTYCVLCS